ncbi:hypothetical protein HMI55_003047, partial [Coelomomyces lativittatus]
TALLAIVCMVIGIFALSFNIPFLIIALYDTFVFLYPSISPHPHFHSFFSLNLNRNIKEKN